MTRIDKTQYQKRLSRISEIFTGIAKHAEVQAQSRCPYKNRFDQCTAHFACANKRKPRTRGELPACVSDDKLDYRSAWKTDPDGYEAMRQSLRTGRKSPAPETAPGLVCHGGETRPAQVGKTIFDYADELDVRVPTSCGRTGYCHECIVEIKRGMSALSLPSESEAFLSGDYRLACQAVVEKIDDPIEFSILRRAPKILTSQTRRVAQIDPVVTRRGDHVCYDGQVIDPYHGHIFGIALDVGTTTVVLELVDLESGELVYAGSFENPQRFGGSDVMHRISYDAGQFQGELHRAIINTVNSEIRSMCTQLGISRREIYEIVVVANSTMRDIFFDLDVQSIGQKPYKSSIELEYLEGNRDTTSLNYGARKLAIMANKNARIYGAPLIASHVGADVVADLVAINMVTQSEVVMLVDAGTNTEVVLGHKDRLFAASCPAGPAFEGGGVTYGMPGCEGAIESIQYRQGNGWASGRFVYETIGDVDPQGICGSGLIDLLAQLRRHDLMTPKCVFANKARQFDIVPEHGITFSRNDASELAQAKAANYCGQIILMRHFGIRPDQISKLYLAGGFANFVNAQSAIDIGFLSPVPISRIVKVGNAAAQGAREMLLSNSKRQAVEALIKKVEHIELETMSDFFEVFVEGCQIKPMLVE